jgi:hypothetical protein
VHPRLGRRRQAVGEPVEVAQREGGEEEIRRSVVDHAAKLEGWVQPRINRSVDLGLTSPVVDECRVGGCRTATARQRVTRGAAAQPASGHPDWSSGRR